MTTILTGVLTGGSLAFAEGAFAFLKEVSKFMIVMAMSAIGLNTDVVKLIRTGAKPILLGFTCWVCISAVSILVQGAIGML